MLQVGGAALGLSLTRLLQAEAVAGGKPRAKSVVILFLSGGPSQLDMWDMKPEAPDDIRGTYRSIPTTVPGTHVCEYLPRMARLAHHYTLIRSMSHNDEDHLRACYWVQTGAELPRVARSGMLRTDRPHCGSVLNKVLGQSARVPSFVTIPEFIHPVGPPRPGQHAGFLGAAYDPYLIDSDPNERDYRPGPIGASAGSRMSRAARLRQLLDSAERHDGVSDELPAVDEYRTFREKALDLVSTPDAQAAFDIERESPKTRDRYGRHHFGQSALVARRLIEAGSRLVQVNFMRHDDGKGGQGYDSHASPGYPKHLPWLRDELLPPTDSAFSSLVEDLHDRGLLDDTIVLMMGEFGRTPRFNKDGGRDHWAKCYSMVAAGGGFTRGAVFGKSDLTTSEVLSDPVKPQDLLATVYHQLGIPLSTEIHDPEDRPWPIIDGQVIRGLLA